MKNSIYIETSVVSYYTARRSRDLIIAGRQELTADWWEKKLGYECPIICTPEELMEEQS